MTRVLFKITPESLVTKSQGVLKQHICTSMTNMGGPENTHCHRTLTSMISEMILQQKCDINKTAESARNSPTSSTNERNYMANFERNHLPLVYIVK